jgi:imidazolonepropionase
MTHRTVVYGASELVVGPGESVAGAMYGLDSDAGDVSDESAGGTTVSDESAGGTTVSDGSAGSATVSDGPLEVIRDGALVAEDGEVVAVGSTAEILTEYSTGDDTEIDADTVIDADGKLVTPGFVDPHTHAVFAGDRTDEYVAKLQGTSYEEIHDSGGGILSTVRSVREASVERLTANLREHLDTMLQHGSTTVEVKSGYGLSTDAELKLLRAVEIVAESHPARIVPTFMGAHAVPEDVDPDEYVTEVIEEQLPAVAEQGIAQFCDVFCDRGAFTAEQSRRVLEAGTDAGLTPKIHADEFEAIGGIEAAADVGAVSADHLLQTDAEGRDTLAEAGVTPVVLPGTAFALGEAYADARSFLDAGVPVALATDFNPNCYGRSMGFAVTLGCVGMEMTPAEALRGATSTAASALAAGETEDVPEAVGTLRRGAPADLLVHDAEKVVDVAYAMDVNTVETVLIDGEEVA